MSYFKTPDSDLTVAQLCTLMWVGYHVCPVTRLS